MGVDKSSDMVALSKDKYPNISFVCGAVIDYQNENRYDLITCTCDSINHILEKEDVEKVFQNVFSMLNENGYFIFDMVSKDKIILNQEFKSVRSKEIVVKYLLEELKNGFIKNNMTVYKQDEIIYKEVITERIYLNSEILELLMKNGFEIVKCDSHIGSEKMRVSKMYIIAKKKRGI